jgi:DNA-binding transcriptional regulator LsrR (DeoR family)
VHIDVTAGDNLDHTASEALRRAYGLRRAFVTTPRAGATVASVAAELLSEIVGADEVLGLAWSRTVNDVVEALDHLSPCAVVQLCGTYALPWRHDTSAETVSAPERSAVAWRFRFTPLWSCRTIARPRQCAHSPV